MVVVVNYYATKWGYIGPVTINFKKTTLGLFCCSFLKWYDRLKIEKSPKLATAMNLVKDVSFGLEQYVQQCRLNTSLNHQVTISSKADISNFIKKDLKLSENHARVAFMFKALILAHRHYKHELLYNAKNFPYSVDKYKYFHTVMYHLYLSGGQIKARNCVILHRFD